ncbi:hypothetical protein IJ00_25205 [Calothrix sp. 336/3]|nr:hypothetical protein IJ00_25205 [Calothrix sp. 336/3]
MEVLVNIADVGSSFCVRKNNLRFYNQSKLSVQPIFYLTWMVTWVEKIDLVVLTIATLTYCNNSVYPLMPFIHSSPTLEFELEILTRRFMKKLSFLLSIWQLTVP